MILLAAFLLLVAVGLLATGIAQGSSALEWASFAASAAAAAVLVVGELRRRRAGRADGTVAPADEASVRSPQRAAAPLAGPPTDPAGSAPVGAVTAPRSGSGPGAAAVDATPEVPARSSGRAGSPHAGEPEPAAARVPVPVAERAPEPAHGPETAGEPVHASRHSAPEGGQPVVPAGVPATAAAADDEPPTEEVEFTDLLLIMDLRDEVLVVDEHPHYHLAGCRHLAGAETFPMPMDEARTDGFTPCGVCAPDRHIAERERARRAS